MRHIGSVLPIDAVLDELHRALSDHGTGVLIAPPGAGKTTRVPLALLDAEWLLHRRIIMLEPRRLAARAAATFMARSLGERVGGTVGYRIRGDSRVSDRTRVEVVTEGVLGRMIVDDPSLDGIGALIFDEFHERSIHADVGLALALQTRELLRPELRLIVMSATIAAEPVAALLDAPIVRATARAFPVEKRYLPRPRVDDTGAAVGSAILRAVIEQPGDVLAFLPGEAEIRSVERTLRENLPPGIALFPLYSALPQDLQDRAIAPSPAGSRKVVLATSIAETSLTIEGVRVVVDSGLSRIARFSPRSGMRRLETVRVSHDAAEQRCGRAGRVAPGVCYRLWPAEEDAQLVPHRAPEILETDLAPLALDLAAAGIRDVSELRWLDAPPAGAFAQARALLVELRALDAGGRLTEHGRRMASLGTHPRLAHMLLEGVAHGLGGHACDIAALLGDRDVLRGAGDGPSPVDIGLRLEAMRTGHAPVDTVVHRGALQRAREESRRLRERIPGPRSSSTGKAEHAAGVLVALAYPDRVGMRRAGKVARYVLRNGRGALIPPGGGLDSEEFIVAAELDDRRPESRVFLAASLSRDELFETFADQIERADLVEWDDAAQEVRSRRLTRLGAIILADDPLPNPPADAVARAVAHAVRRRGLSALHWTDEATRLRARLAFLHRLDAANWRDVSDETLLAELDEWLLPFLGGARRRAELERVPLGDALIARVAPALRRRIEELAPDRIEVPTGSKIAVDYSSDEPILAVRLQELFGLEDTPRIGGGRVPVTLQLLSPAQRPMQVTRDLAGFWRGAYFEVRKELRARYPKHRWPEDPLTAEPTRSTRRKS